MAVAPLPSQESERLDALHAYGVLDTPPETAFDELAALAARICGTPISLVSLIDHGRQWFKAHHGTGLTAAPRDVSFCAHVICEPGDLLVVTDAARDPRFAESPLVTGEPGIRFYAGVPLCTPEGHAIGTLCVIDRQPRTLSADQQEALRVLGHQVMARLELRRSLNDTILNRARLENSQRIAALGDWEYDFADQRLIWSEEIYRLLGILRADASPDAEIFYRHVHPDDLAFVHREKKAAAEGLRRGDFEHRIIRADGSTRHVHQITEMVFDDQGRPSRELGTIQDITARKRSEEALRQSEERYRALGESAPLGIFECDAAGKVIFCNPAMVALSGRPAGENLGWGWAESIHPGDRAAMSAGWASVRAGGGTWNQDQRLVQPDGSVRWVRTLVAASKGLAGGAPGFVVAVEDITGHRRADAELRGDSDREEHRGTSRAVRELAAVVSVAVLVFAFLYRFRIAQGLVQSVGEYRAMPLDEVCATLIIISPVLAFFSYRRFRDSRIEVARHREARQALRIMHGELDKRVQQRTAELVQVNGALQAEIIERKQAEESMRESEARFKFVARAVSDVVWDWNLAANTFWWNDGFMTTFGFAPGEIEPSVESWAGRIHPDDRSRVVDSARNAIDTGAETWTAEYRFRRKDGSHAFVQDRGYILRDPAGRGIRMVGGMRDLTEQKTMEAQRQRSQRMESIGTLAGGIAHDLNNVLAPILMSIELLKFDSGDDPRRSKILDTIYVSCRRGADLVRQVLSFARGFGGEHVPVHLRRLVVELEGIITQTFPRNIRVVTEVPEGLWSVVGDPTQLHQVLLNLVVNARDAMPDGGTLRLSAANATVDARTAAAIPEAREGTFVELRVSDTGQGIRPEIRERIFEPFFSSKEFGKGTGIGLATVKTIVKSHGGFIGVESEVGRGATFRIFLPADPARESAVSAHPFKASLPLGRGELVLVVDDEFSIRDITQQTLEAFGYRVITASDGSEAIALYAKHAQEIAVVLTDMMMPVMDGSAVIQVLQRISPDVKVIATSGVDSGKGRSRAGFSGVKHFLLKPYTAESLLRLVREVIEGPAR